MEIMRTPWSRIREQNSVYREFLEIVGNGKPTGSVWKETIAVSATIWISVGKVHHQILLRILSCGRVSENHRGHEVPEARVPVVECFDGPARITSEELAITHPAKDGILLKACSTRTRMVAVLGKSVRLHIVRLTHSRRNGPNRIMTKAPWLFWKRVNWHERGSVTDRHHDRSGKPVKRSDKKLGRNSSKRQLSDARQLGCVFQDMTPPKWHPPECLYYKTKSCCRFGRKVLIRTSSGWWTADKKIQKEWWQKCCGHNKRQQHTETKTRWETREDEKQEKMKDEKMKDERQDKTKDKRKWKTREKMKDKRRHQPMVQMTTPQVGLKCLINCLPSGN